MRAREFFLHLGFRLSTLMQAALHFFAGEPRLMSAGADNALKQWLFDAGDGAARLLRFRSGHAAPPAVVRFYGDAGTRLLSAGDTAGRISSVMCPICSRLHGAGGCLCIAGRNNGVLLAVHAAGVWCSTVVVNSLKY